MRNLQLCFHYKTEQNLDILYQYCSVLRTAIKNTKLAVDRLPKIVVWDLEAIATAALDNGSSRV